MMKLLLELAEDPFQCCKIDEFGDVEARAFVHGEAAILGLSIAVMMMTLV
jgi:hypothetical protein